MTTPQTNLNDAHCEPHDISDAAGESPELFYLDPNWLLVDRDEPAAVVRAIAGT